MANHLPYTSYEAPPINHHHRSYTLNYKLKVVQWIEEQRCSLRAASKEFGLDRKVLRSWLKNKDKLKSAVSLHGPEKKKLHHGRPPKSQKLDKQVFDYLCSLQNEGVNVCDQELQRKAREYAETLGLKDFKAAATWLKRWKQRCGVNATNEITNSKSDNKAGYHLSHVICSEPVKLMTHWTSSTRSCDVNNDGPIHYDTSTNEHNYCKTAVGDVPSFSPSDGLHSTDTTYRLLQSKDDQSFPMTSSDHPAVLTVFEVVPPSNDDVTMMFNGECIMGSLDLPLSHEEIVKDDDNGQNDHHITQTTFQDVSFYCDLQSQPSILTKTQSISKPSNNKRSRTTKKRTGKGRSQTCHQTTARKPDKPSEVSLVQVTLPNLMLDDPQGPSGLLASRILQPVFPDEPEIVYMDMQLGTLTH